MRRVAGNGSDFRVLHEMAHHPVRSIAVEEGVAVDADQDFILGEQAARLQCHGLALVLRQVHHAQVVVFGGQAVQYFSGVVLAAIVDGDHLEVGIVGRQGVADGFLCVIPLIETGDKDADRRRVRQGGGLGVRTVLAFMAPVKQCGADHPQIGHEQRVVEHETQQSLP